MFITLFLFTTISSGKENENLTDEELLNVCLSNAGKKIASALLQKGYKNISVVENSLVQEEHSNFILMESFVNEIKKGEGSIFLKKRDIETDKPILSYRIIEKKVNIEERNRFFSESVIERHATVKISYRLIDPKTGELLIANEIDESLKNRISKKAYTSLKKAIIKKGVSFSSLLEPAIVTAIIGGLMYLFYSQKSSK